MLRITLATRCRMDLEKANPTFSFTSKPNAPLESGSQMSVMVVTYLNTSSLAYNIISGDCEARKSSPHPDLPGCECYRFSLPQTWTPQLPCLPHQDGLITPETVSPKKPSSLKSPLSGIWSHPSESSEYSPFSFIVLGSHKTSSANPWPSPQEVKPTLTMGHLVCRILL